jgi:hypothetical protein
MTKIAGSGSIRHGSVDPEPDPHQKVMDPEHWMGQPRDETKDGGWGDLSLVY